MNFMDVGGHEADDYMDLLYKHQEKSMVAQMRLISETVDEGSSQSPYT